MVAFKALLLELLILANYYWYKTQSEKVTTTQDFQIAALLSNELVLSSFVQAVQASDVRKINDKFSVRFSAMGELMKENTLQTTDQVCDFVLQSQGFLCAVIVSHPPNRTDLPPLSVSFTTAFFEISTIGISARQSIFSDKNSHRNFLRTITPYSQESRVFISLIDKFSWKHINVIYSDNHEGKTLLSLLERKTEVGYQIRAKVALKGDQNFTEGLHEMSREQTRVVILYCPTEMAEDVFTIAQKLGMFAKDWAWLVTEQALKANNVPPGVVGVRLSQTLEMEHMKDAVEVVKRGVVNAMKKDIRPFIKNNKFKALFRTNCSGKISEKSLEPGNKLLKFLRDVKIYRAEKEPLSFDSMGDREQAKYVIVNKHLPADVEEGEDDLVEVGRFETRAPDKTATSRQNKDSLEINMDLIKWPPGNKQYKIAKKECQNVGVHLNCRMTKELAAPRSFKKKTHLKVVTKESIPFVYTRPLKEGEKCDTSTDPKKPKKEVECTHTDPDTKKVTVYCCRGYCIDLLRRLANRTRIDDSDSSDMENSFSYDLHLVGDNKIGEKVTENGQSRWTGIVEEIYSGVADLGVSPMTITPERATRIEFTKPFKYLGLTILVKRESHPKSNLGSFLQPFANTLWVLVFLSVHVVALVLYLLDRFSPFGRYKFARGADTEEDALNLSSAMWFAWGVLLNSGIGEGTPRSFSARVLGMVWAGFAMIIVASYTANLAAFLVLDRPEALLSGIDDARLRNPQKDFKFATVKGSHVEAYFKSQLEYDTMLRIMTKNVYHTPEAAIEAVKSGELKAFIWDSARLEFEAASECDLKTAGEVFGRTGYGLAMRKDSPWMYEISQAVLNFHERGVMETLDSEWILVKAKGCPRTDMSPATLGLTNMAGVFIMVAAGIVAGVFLIFIEMAYKKRTGLKEKELELARNAVDRWRGNVVKRKILRNTLAAEGLEKAMPLLGGGGVSPYPPALTYNNPTYERQRDCPKRVVQLTNQNGIFAEQPAMERV